MGFSAKALLRRRDACSVCGGRLTVLFELPNLPLTDTYSAAPPDLNAEGHDQRFAICERCHLGQLENLLAPDVLYQARNYRFRTSESATARRGSAFFLSVLEQFDHSRNFHCILDVGCNDLYLLRELAQRSERRIGIDPILRGHESESEKEGIISIGRSLEEVGRDELPVKPDLILCRHTLEHVLDPRSFLQRLFEMSADHALFLFEVPGFDALIERLRFDQIFHQHVNYFSLHSFMALLDSLDARYITHRINYHDWGAMAVAFSKDGSATIAEREDIPKVPAAEIGRRYQVFLSEMRASKGVMEASASGVLYGYGAAQMLPVIAYHMGTDFHELKCILDDDPAKDGIGYRNLPVRIMHAAKAHDLSRASVIITAFDNAQQILMRLLRERPRHIILPLNLI